MYYTVKIKFDLVDTNSKGEQKVKKVSETYLVEGDTCKDVEEKTINDFEGKFKAQYAAIPSYEIKSVVQSKIVSIIA